MAAMGVSFGELRERCQRPVAGSNDIAGLLFGDKLSLPLTKLWVDSGMSPDIATIGMLVTGVAGAGLNVVGGAWALAGAVLLLLYYLLDCVDGEVARFRGVQNMKWGYLDYVFHLLVKPLAFLGIGLGLYFETRNWLFVLAAATAAVSTLWLKLFLEIPGIVFLKDVMSGNPAESKAFQNYYAGLGHSLEEKAAEGGRGGFKLKFDRVAIRAFLTNFDVSLVLLVLATAADMGWRLTELMSWRGVWLLWYGAVLPLDFLDYLVSYIRRGHFDSEMKRLLTLAHQFKLKG